MKSSAPASKARSSSSWPALEPTTIAGRCASQSRWVATRSDRRRRISSSRSSAPRGGSSSPRTTAQRSYIRASARACSAPLASTAWKRSARNCSTEIASNRRIGFDEQDHALLRTLVDFGGLARSSRHGAHWSSTSRGLTRRPLRAIEPSTSLWIHGVIAFSPPSGMIPILRASQLVSPLSLPR